MNNNKAKISYDVEADVLRVEISKQPIDYAKEMGNIVVHLTREGMPVYLEVLEAKRFLTKTRSILERTKTPKFSKIPA